MCAPTPVSHHTHQHTFLHSVSPVYRETSVIIEFYGCDYHRQGLEAAILVHLFPSSPLFSLYGSPLFSSIDLVWATVWAEAGFEAISTKWQTIGTSYISHGIKGNPLLRKWAATRTHLDTNTHALARVVQTRLTTVAVNTPSHWASDIGIDWVWQGTRHSLNNSVCVCVCMREREG